MAFCVPVVIDDHEQYVIIMLLRQDQHMRILLFVSTKGNFFVFLRYHSIITDHILLNTHIPHAKNYASN